MPTGEGKGWAKDRTAATDGRVARAAAAHRGLSYRRHVPVELDRRLLNGAGNAARRTLALEWSPVMAYVVGLMATDGCLLSRRKQLNFKSEDEALVLTFLRCLGRPPVTRHARGRTGNLHYFTQFGDVEFYSWLSSVGLMPRKSLVIGALSVPDVFLFHLARGLLDGDGSIINEWYAGTGKAKGRMYETLLTRFVCGSLPHLEWLRSVFQRLLGISGCLIKPTAGKNAWALSYAIRESCALLPRIYPDDHLPRLDRKWFIWKAYADRHGHPSTLSDLPAPDETCHQQRSHRDSLGRFRSLSRANPDPSRVRAI